MNQAELLINALFRHFGVVTQEDLAKKLNTTQGVIAGWKSRNSVKTISKLVRELDIDLDIDLKSILDQKAQIQTGRNNVQVGRDMQTLKNAFEIEDQEIAALCYGAYTSAKALGKIDKLKEYLALAPSAILN